MTVQAPQITFKTSASHPRPQSRAQLPASGRTDLCTRRGVGGHESRFNGAESRVCGPVLHVGRRLCDPRTSRGPPCPGHQHSVVVTRKVRGRRDYLADAWVAVGASPPRCGCRWRRCLRLPNQPSRRLRSATSSPPFRNRPDCRVTAEVHRANHDVSPSGPVPSKLGATRPVCGFSTPADPKTPGRTGGGERSYYFVLPQRPPGIVPTLMWAAWPLIDVPHTERLTSPASVTCCGFLPFCSTNPPALTTKLPWMLPFP